MEVPGSWESRGLTAFDGVVWFTREIDWPADRRGAATVRFGRLGNIGEVWVNGTSVAAAAVDPTAGRSPQVFEVPDGVLKPGANTITVRIQNLRGDGGFLGAPDALVVQSGEHKTALGRHVALPRRAADQRAGALQPAGRAGRPRRLGRDAAAGRRRAGRDAGHRQGRRRAAPRRPEGSAEVGPGGDDRRGRAARRPRRDEHRRDAAQLHPRGPRLARGHRRGRRRPHEQPHRRRSSSSCPTCRRSSPRPACSNRASRSPSSSAPRASPGPTPMCARFPGHWRLMNGVLTVTAGRPSEP